MIQESTRLGSGLHSSTDVDIAAHSRSRSLSSPANWKSKQIIQIVDNIIDYRGRTPRKLGMEWGGGDIPALSARNVRMGYIDFSQETYYGSEALYNRWMTNGDPKKGDIVVTMEAPLGNIALIPDDKRYILSQRTVLHYLCTLAERE